MLKIANVREIKELEKRMMREMKNEDLLIILIIIEMDLVKRKRWEWE